MRKISSEFGVNLLLQIHKFENLLWIASFVEIWIAFLFLLILNINKKYQHRSLDCTMCLFNQTSQDFVPIR